MFKNNTIIIEMTGIMGAGYLPKLFDPLTQKLRTGFLRVNPSNKSTRLVTRWYVDNSNAEERDLEKRNRIDTLFKNAERLNSDEWTELEDSVKWIDNLFEEAIENWHDPVDVVFRRGGLLQAYILLRGTRWQETNLKRKHKPSMQIFLTASLPTIKHTYANDKGTLEVIRSKPNDFCQTPERAYEQQQKWLENLKKDIPGVVFIERQKSNIEGFANDIINEVLPHLTIFGFRTEAKRGNEFDYDIAISFAGENRSIAQDIADSLSEYGVKVFYDKYEQANLWGKDLYSHLSNVYSKRARYCLMIISHYYAKKQWTTHERQAAQSKAFRENEEYILPLKLDDTEIPGLLPTTGYIDFRHYSIEDIVNLIIQKLKRKR